MNKALLITVPLLVVLILGAFFYNVYKFSQPTAEIKGHKFELVLAKSEKDKQTGLSKYKSIPENKGMLFLFDRDDVYPFWMKDMKFPIDILFIKDDKVVTIYQNLPINNLSVYSPTEPVNKVLEINANLSKKYGITQGDIVAFKNIK